MRRFTEWLESVFDKEADYWLGKKDVPKKLQQAIEPHLNKGLKLLDLGCGGGRLAASLKAGFKGVSGMDYSADLLRRASEDNPDVNFKCGNFQLPSTWQGAESFDVIVSNCAIRKDYCNNFARVATLCHEHLNDGGALILRIQAFEDLRSILPEQLRREKFYTDKEVAAALSSFKAITTEHEIYHQKFSSVDYMRKFLNRINIDYDGPIKDLNPVRHYYIVKAVR